MNIVITSRHMELTPAMRAVAEEKANKLTKFYDRIQEIEVVIEVVDHGTASVEMIVNCEHNAIFVAKDKEKDAYVAMDACMHKLERQLSDHKKIHRNRKHPTA